VKPHQMIKGLFLFEPHQNNYVESGKPQIIHGLSLPVKTPDGNVKRPNRESMRGI